MARLCRYCHKPFSRAYNRDRHERRGCWKRIDQEPVGDTTMGDIFEEVPPYSASEERIEDEERNQDEEEMMTRPNAKSKDIHSMSRVKPNSITKCCNKTRSTNCVVFWTKNCHPSSPQNRTTLQRIFSSHSIGAKEVSVGLQQTHSSTWYRHHVPLRIQTHRGGFVHRRSSWFCFGVTR